MRLAVMRQPRFETRRQHFPIGQHRPYGRLRLRQTTGDQQIERRVEEDDAGIRDPVERLAGGLMLERASAQGEH
jgi:hypothetical protein